MNIKKAAMTVLSITFYIVVLALILMGLMRLGTAAYHYGYSIFHAQALDPAPGREMKVHIENEDSAGDIGKQLQEKGLIEDWKLFMLQVKLSKYSKTIVPGDYVLSTAMTPKEMMAVMSGETPEEDEES